MKIQDIAKYHIFSPIILMIMVTSYNNIDNPNVMVNMVCVGHGLLYIELYSIYYTRFVPKNTMLL